MTNSNIFGIHKLTYLLISFFLVSFSINANANDSIQVQNRIASDIERDKTSKPKQIISFSEVEKGALVLDLFGGGGYYSELFAKQIGEDGMVTLHNNSAYLPFVGVELEIRLSDNRLKNVSKLMSEAKDLKLGRSKYDLVVLVLGYHDFFYTSDKWDVTADLVMPQVLSSLKKGGRFLVVDHNAVKGTQHLSAQSLHRIDANYAKRDIQARGFKFVKESSILRNPDDPLDIKVFNPKIRRKTDRFVFLFEKP